MGNSGNTGGDTISVRDLVNAVRALVNRGFKTVLVNNEKRPIHEWKGKVLDVDEATELIEKSMKASSPDKRPSGVAIDASYYVDPKFSVLVIDIDDVKHADPIMSSVFGDNWLEYLCGQPESFCGLTGPRCPRDGEKHNITCTRGVSGDYVCTHYVNDNERHVFNLSEAPRGMYIVVRYPSSIKIESTIRGGVIELLKNNYQVVFGIHPSGVPYQTFKITEGERALIDITKVGDSVVLSEDEVNQLVTAVSAGKPISEALAGDVEATGLPEPTISLSEDQVKTLIDSGKAFMRMKLKSGQHIHDLFLFGLSCVMRRVGIKYDDARKVVEGILDYSVSIGEDTERDKINHLKQTVDWIYKPGNKRIWGVRKFRETMLALLSDVEGPDNVKELGKLLIEQILNTLNVNEPGDVGCVPEQAEHQPQLGVFRVTRWICNDREMGISHVVIKPNKKRSSGDEGEIEIDRLEELIATTYTKKKLVNIYINNLSYYKDAILSDMNYVKVDYVVLGPNGPLMPGDYSGKLMNEDDFVNKINRKHIVNRSPDWRTILHSTKPIIDVIVSGFVCPPPDVASRYGLQCGVRDYFDVGLNIDPDLNKAIKFVETALFGAPAKLHPEPAKWRAGLIFGSMLNFAYTQKLHGYKTFMLTLVGTTNSGKTTIGSIVNWAFAPKVNTILPASSSITPARIGRASTRVGAVGTFPITFDEFSRVSADMMSTVLSTLRSYVTSLEAWTTATGERYPATYGIIITSNTLPPMFINSLRDKILIIEYTSALNRETINAIHDVIETELKDYAVHFGVSFLRFIVERWAQVKPFILNARWTDHVLDVFNEYLKYLGMIQRLTWDDVYKPGVTIEADFIVPALHNFIWNTLEPHRTCRSIESSDQVNYVECAIWKIRDYGLPYITEAPAMIADYYIEQIGNPNIDPKSLFIIKKAIENVLGVGIEVICTKLNGVLYKGNGTSGKYYKSCIITEDTLRSLLQMEIATEGENEDSGGSN